MDKGYEVVSFVDGDFELDVKADFDNETVWLSTDEMASLFGVGRTRTIRHISNIYGKKEFDGIGTCSENAQVGKCRNTTAEESSTVGKGNW